MSRKPITVALGLAVACVVGGCGTVLNTVNLAPHGEAPQRVYGGVQFDAEEGVQAIKQAFESDDQLPDTERGGRPIALATGAYYLLIDLPLCVVGDTLTLPWTVAAELGRER
ncbi:MAG: YceK/YidQ family lipoprotein [Gemmataceae bacterium]|nr:YceK/YidQ family lipoprotein [Gemmataceae bacterium]